MRKIIWFSGFLCLLMSCGNTKTQAPTPGTTPDKPTFPTSNTSKDSFFVPINKDLLWLNATSLVDETRPKECPKASSLYRMSSDSFFTLVDVVKNMLGDETREHYSWRMGKMLREAGFNKDQQPSLDQWRVLKDQARETIQQEIKNNLLMGRGALSAWRQKHPGYNQKYGLFDYDDLGKCVLFARDSEINTWRDAPTAAKENSFGIAFASLFDKAITPVLRDKPITKPGETTVFEIKESVPRAALTTMGKHGLSWFIFMSKSNKPGALVDTEYYVPIVVPFHDIKSAISERYVNDPGHSHGLEKVETADGKGLIEIRIYKQNGVPKDSWQFGELEGRLVPCQSLSDCKSDKVESKDLELRQIILAATYQPINGYHFKYVASP